MAGPHGRSEGPDSRPRPLLRPSQFTAGYTVGEPAPEPPPDHPGIAQAWNPFPPQGSPAQPAPWDYTNASSSQLADGPDPYRQQSPSYQPPARRNGALVFAALAAAVALSVGGFMVGRLTAPPTPDHVDTASPRGLPPIGSTVSAPPESEGIRVTDPANDAVPHPVDEQVHGPSEIVSQSLRSDDGLLVITMEFSSTTPMNLISTGFRIKLDPNAVPTCNDSVLDSWDWSVDYDTDGIEIFQHGSDCEDRFQPTNFTGSFDITGSTLEIRINESSLGLSPGQRLSIRSCVSTRIDSESTTFIQDWAPDNADGATGEI